MTPPLQHLLTNSDRYPSDAAWLVAACIALSIGVAISNNPSMAAEPCAANGESKAILVNHAARENPKSAVAEAARILAAKEYLLFIDTFMAPETRAQFKPGELEGQLHAFETDGPALLNVFRACRGLEPNMEGEDEAYFVFSKPIDARTLGSGDIEGLRLKRHGKYWYVVQ